MPYTLTATTPVVCPVFVAIQRVSLCFQNIFDWKQLVIPIDMFYVVCFYFVDIKCKVIIVDIKCKAIVVGLCKLGYIYPNCTAVVSGIMKKRQGQKI